jgi:hypothetical protein
MTMGVAAEAMPLAGLLTRVLWLTNDSQIGANLRVCVDEEDRADFVQRR